MNRRDFLMAATAAPAAAAIPGWLRPLPGVLTLADLRRVTNSLMDNAGFAFVINPVRWRDVLDLHARDLWRTEYRQWRKRRGAGEDPGTLHELMLRVRNMLKGPPHDDMLDAMPWGYKIIMQERLP